ncbi:MAG: sugar transferase [Chloroflexi bacterium]|nr:sugar transferase [Chloroflexota bacterium]
MAELQKTRNRRWLINAHERQFILVLGDVICSAIALVIALYFWAQKDQWISFSLQFIRERPPTWFYLLPMMWIVLMLDLYNVRKAGNRRDTIQGILISTVVATILYLFVFFVAEPNTLPRRGVAVFIGSVAIFTLMWRFIYIDVFTAPTFLRRVLIIGAGRSGCTMAKIIKNIWPSPFFLVGFIDDDEQKKGRNIEGLAVLGNNRNLLKVIREQHVTDLIFSISGEMQPETFAAILQAKENGIEVITMPILYEELIGRVPIFLLEDDWILRSFVDHARSTSSYETLKRILDIFVATVGLFLLVVLTPALALIILLDGGRPILYRQERVGISGKPFTLLKFRTMRQDAEEDGKPRLAVENDERVTKVGRFLRRSHLDELPQFINILKGDISMVGPRAERPEFVHQLEQEIPFYRARLFVKPGMTGWAQINYRYASNVEESAIKLEYDLYYIKHRSIWLDITIILRTMGQVVGLRGV